MSIPSSRPAEVEAAVRALAETCSAAGYTVRSRRPIDYGMQLTVGGGEKVATVNVYGGRKGLSIVVNGAPVPSVQAAVSVVAAGLSAGATPAAPAKQPALLPVAQTSRFPVGPWIGSDESGKGDYFGPLVAAAVYVAPHEESALRAAGVRDSKALTDAAARQIAASVRRLCAGRFAEEVIPPPEYNALYERFKEQNENLNHLLAWGHVHVLEPLLAGGVSGDTAPTVIADQFADERYVRERLQQTLQQRGLPLPRLIQAPRAEANVAVAAASVLARDRFLAWLEDAANRYGIALPKGGSNPAIIAAARRIVDRHGPAELANVVKLHFATTKAISRFSTDVGDK